MDTNHAYTHNYNTAVNAAFYAPLCNGTVYSTFRRRQSTQSGKVHNRFKKQDTAAKTF